jgi:hypothetical protein
MASCSLVEVDLTFQRCVLPPDDDEVTTSEMSVYIYETTQRHLPEGCHLHTRHCQKLIFFLQNLVLGSCHIWLLAGTEGMTRML